MGYLRKVSCVPNLSAGYEDAVIDGNTGSRFNEVRNQ